MAVQHRLGVEPGIAVQPCQHNARLVPGVLRQPGHGNALLQPGFRHLRASIAKSETAGRSGHAMCAPTQLARLLQHMLMMHVRYILCTCK